MGNKRSKNIRCIICNIGLYHKTKTGMCLECFRLQSAKEKILKWLTTGDIGCSTGTTIRYTIRNFINDYQDGKCAICTIEGIWDGSNLNFILDHIDGNASNNRLYNLRLICPNCDSQLDTYKSKNKNSARKHRKKYYSLT